MVSEDLPRYLDELATGAHLCMLYETEEEHRDTVQPFLLGGILAGNKLIYIAADHDPEIIRGYLAASGLDPQRYESNDQLQFRTVEEVYGTPGILEPEHMEAMLQAETKQALAEGFTGLRLSGEVTWQAAEPEGMDLYHYHSQLNEFLPGTKCLALCQYDTRIANPEAIKRVLMTHPMLLKGERLIRNPFYAQSEDDRDEGAGAQEARIWMECISDLQDLMERKRVPEGTSMPYRGEAVEQERDFIAAVLDTEGALVIVMDREARIELFNRACEAVTGYTFAEVRGKPFFDLFIPEEERAAVLTVFRDLRAGNFPNTFENHWLTKEGKKRLFAWANTALIDGDGNVEHIIGTGIDVTERRRLEAALRESEQRSRAVSDMTTDLVFELDLAENRMLWFGDVDVWLGYPAGEYPNSFESWMERMHPDDREKIQKTIQESVGSGKPFSDEHRVIKSDGSILYWRARAMPLLDENGVPYKWIGAISDVTHDRKAEEGLRQSEARFRSLFENAPFGILIHRLGTVLFANRALLEMFGVKDFAEVQGMSLLDFVVPEERERILDNIRRRMAGEDIPSAYETVGLGPNGRNIPLYIVVVALELEDGPALMVYLVDITDRKRYEEALRQRADELRDFLTIAAHELRHPITILKGYVRVLEEYGDNLMVQERLPEILGNVDKASSRLDRLVEELLDVSRVEQGRLIMGKEHVETESVIARAIDEMSIRGTPNPISSQVAPGAERVFADPEKLVRILVILLENAANFSNPGDPVDIEVVRRSPAEVLFSVLDRGIGIPEEARSRVFERFYQVEEVEYHSVPGLGMGLYIARQIAEAHGGTIWNEPREGGGTAFRFTIPAMDKEG